MISDTPVRPPLTFRLGVKTDPIEYRYSHAWLFAILAEEGVPSVQLGTHFELYQLPDEFFHRLRDEAETAGVVIDSLFTAHRELGGFFREEPGYEAVARKNFERYLAIGGMLGARSVGSNPGAVMRDRMAYKAAGTACYIRHAKELMHVARDHGVEWLTIEPMSCLAEPPTLPDEVSAMGEELTAYHDAHPGTTARVGYCADIAHGYSDGTGRVVYDHMALFDATLPWLYEVHLKNTDSKYHSTFGFAEADRARGIIDVSQFRQRLIDRADVLPVSDMTGYLEIGGPKLGRDATDPDLERQLRQSLRFLKSAWLDGTEPATPVPRSAAHSESATPQTRPGTAASNGPGLAGSARRVIVSPSMMCVDMLRFERDLRAVEAAGADQLHIDVMDGVFVPNMPVGMALLQALPAATDLPIDVHLMVTDNDKFLDWMDGGRIAQVSVHVESCVHLDRTLTKVRDLGAKAGLAINPGTPLEVLDYVLERIDYVLVMTVNPGYAGQTMTPASIRKIADCRRRLDAAGRADVPIQVDGNVSFENVPAMVAAGADDLVAGTSSIFHRSGTWPENMRRLRSAIDEGLRRRQDSVATA